MFYRVPALTATDRDKNGAFWRCTEGEEAREKYWRINTLPRLFVVVLIIRRNYERKKNTAWILLVVSGLMEIVWVIYHEAQPRIYGALAECDNHSDIIISFFPPASLSGKYARHRAELYAVFTGIGVVGTTFMLIFCPQGRRGACLKCFRWRSRSSVYSASSSAIRREKKNDVARSHSCKLF